MSTLVARMAAAPPRRRAVVPGMALAGLVLAALAALPVAAEAAGLPFLVVTATRMMIFGLAALSLDLVLGYGAMVSFGHAAFIGLGAYAVGILDAHGIRDLAVQAPVAAELAHSRPRHRAISLRTRGVYFIMITLAFGQMAYFFMVSLAPYGGDDGLPLSGRSTCSGCG